MKEQPEFVGEKKIELDNFSLNFAEMIMNKKRHS